MLAPDVTLRPCHDHCFAVADVCRAWLPLTQVTHGRAAMMGFSGIIHQMIISKQGTIEQLMNFKSVDPAAFKGLAGLSTAPVLAGGAASWPF